jgi:threonine aldolase
MIELRSDTFTLPTPAMRRAIAGAAVGNDEIGEDPTVNRLERMAAERVGMEAACLMPSGTMANLASILAHAPRGSSVLAGDESDIYLYEAAGASVCGGIGYVPVRNQPDGSMLLDDLDAAFPEDPTDPQFALPALLCLENTHNRCGGLILGPEHVRAVAALARRRGVALHLDGARLFNAAVGSGVTAAALAADFDSVQFCLSKGLGAPVGSMVAGGAAFVGRVRRVRKMLGGGMRQAGVVAAAGVVALDEMVDRLAEDHANARRLAAGLGAVAGLDVLPVHTNIVLFRVTAERYTWSTLIDAARRAGVALGGFGHGRIRAVTHAGVDAAAVDRSVEIIGGLLAGPPDAVAAPITGLAV